MCRERCLPEWWPVMCSRSRVPKAPLPTRMRGINKDVVISGITLGGADAAELRAGERHVPRPPRRHRGARSPKITGIAAADKVYDGTTSATLDVSGATFAGMVAGDALAVASATGAFINQRCGGKQGGYDQRDHAGRRRAGNYELASSTAMATATIKRRVVRLRGSRVYDGTTSLRRGSSRSRTWR